MNKFLLSLLMSAGLASGCGAEMAGQRGSELRVTRAVLYQNGIGYFERRGHIDDDMLRLRVRPDQIKDFLKSLTVVDLGQGHAVSIALPIEKSRAKQLSDLPEQVRTQGGVLAIAQAFRGARCRVEGNITAVGRLVGVENLGAEATPDWRISVLTDGGALTQIKVATVKTLQVLDGSLEIGLRKALDVALDSGSWKPVDVAVRLSKKGAHDLVVSYVVEMPTWKPAYRIVLSDSAPALLQGWAVVDNVSGDDWKGVSLSLTAGTPLAFTYDLYTPRYPRRPNLSLPEAAAAIPEEAYSGEGGLADDQPARAAPEAEAAPPAAASISSGAGSRRSGPGGGYADRADKPSRSMAPPAPPPPPVSSEALERNFRTLVAGATVGSLFRYDLAEPVTIDERQSALVNIVNAKVKGEDCLLFRVGSDSVSPYRAVRFGNDTGFVLEAGPMAIYRTDEKGGTFLGEALAHRIERGANTFMPYAQDGRVRVDLSEEQRQEGVSLVRAVHGVLTIQTKQVTRFTYDVENNSEKETTLYVRRERRPGWTLLDKSKTFEEGGAYYLPIRLAEKGHTKVKIEEETPVQQTVEIWNDMGRTVLDLYLSSTTVDPKVAAALKEALALRDQAGRLDDQAQTLEKARESLSKREEEVRNNIQVLGKSSKNADLKGKLEASLAGLETQLNDVTRKLVQANMERGQVRDRLAVVMNGINL